MVCPVCDGEGKTVNPDIDSNGLTREDFAEDPDFAKDYRAGAYDIICRGCQGRRVIEPERLEELAHHAEERALAAREDGDWESYCGARDWRYG